MAIVPRPAAGRTGLSSPTRLLLDDPARAWRVASGRVDLFAVELVHGEPRGRRHPLGTLVAGDALFGVRGADAGLAVLAVGSSDARVEPLDHASLAARERARLAEGWAETLAAALALDQRAGVLLRVGRPATVEAGGTITSA